MLSDCDYYYKITDEEMNYVLKVHQIIHFRTEFDPLLNPNFMFFLTSLVFLQESTCYFKTKILKLCQFSEKNQDFFLKFESS